MEGRGGGVAQGVADAKKLIYVCTYVEAMQLMEENLFVL
jgi:hypothetical protein